MPFGIDLEVPAVRYNLFAGALLIAFAFYSIRQSDTNTLLSIIVIAGAVWLAYEYLRNQSKTIDAGQDNKIARLDSEAKWQEGHVAERHADMAALPPFPKKGFKYIKTNPILVDIATDLNVIRIFDRARYGDMCHLLNSFQKTYEYILSDRYDAGQYLPIFQDLGDAVIENMYSSVFVLPSKLKHVYGVNPDALVQKNIDRFMVLRRKMSSVLESYAKKELGLQVVPLSLPGANGTARFP
jgi:hypothetical protein